MQLRSFPVFAVIYLATCLASASYGAENIKGYVYDSKAVGDERALVINVAAGNVDIQDKSDVHADAMLSEFGGSYENCGNEAFFCLTGALEIVIPKSMPMKQWEYHGLSCKSVGRPEGDAIRITCRSRNYRGRPTYTYSPSRGVLSIDSSPAGGTRDGFKLRGQHGLFSPGSNP